MERMDNQFILGFIAGEGCFHIALNRKKSGRVRAFPAFDLHVYEKQIIKDIYHHFENIGTIRNRNDRGMVWQVQSYNEAKILHDWVSENRKKCFNVTDKARQFDIWSEAVSIYSTDMSDKDLKRMVDLSFDIAKSNTRNISKETWYERIENFTQNRCGVKNRNENPCKNKVSDKDDTCWAH